MALFGSRERRKGARFLMVCFTLIATLWASAVGATVMLYTGLAELVEMSDVIVQGRVVDQTTFFDEEKQEVATITQVQVDKTFYGDNVGKTIEFRQWGGQYDDKIAAIPGDAQFDPYEECVLFLVDGKGKFAGMRYLANLGQAKYRVIRSGANDLVVRDLTDMAFLNQETNAISERSPEFYQMDEFEPQLRALIKGIKGGAK